MGAHSLSEKFEWKSEYDSILEDIASTDAVQTEWSLLRDIIKFKIQQNIASYLSETEDTKENFVPPPTYSPQTLPSGGLKLAPFPPRQKVEPGITEAPKTFMTLEEANDMKCALFIDLDEFDQNAPFTIQRLGELCLRPRQHYRSVGKYLRAVERTLLVTSAWDAFPALSEADSASPLKGALRLSGEINSTPATPIFSPIPFLHDDARRSKSKSPPPSPLTLPTTGTSTATEPLDTGPRVLGLVDELDDPSPGHLSDHPTALSATTTTTNTPTSRPFLASLDERFVSSGGRVDTTETAQSDNTMMDLDDTDDKENKA